MAGCSRAGAPATSATYDPRTGQLQTLKTDVNRNGRFDTTSFLDGARILRIEVDQDEDGRTDRWDFYRADRTMEKVGLSRANDGVMDALAYYDQTGALARMEISTQRDGRFDRVERYEGGALVSSADDTDGDGRPDTWDRYERASATGEPSVVWTEFDDSGRGRPERRFVYGPGGVIVRVELDLDGDGRFTERR